MNLNDSNRQTPGAPQNPSGTPNPNARPYGQTGPNNAVPPQNGASQSGYYNNQQYRQNPPPNGNGTGNLPPQQGYYQQNPQVGNGVPPSSFQNNQTNPRFSGNFSQQNTFNNQANQRPAGNIPQQNAFNNQMNQRPTGNVPQQNAFNNQMNQRPTGNVPQQNAFNNQMNQRPTGNVPQQNAFNNQMNQRPTGNIPQQNAFNNQMNQRPTGNVPQQNAFNNQINQRPTGNVPQQNAFNNQMNQRPTGNIPQQNAFNNQMNQRPTGNIPQQNAFNNQMNPSDQRPTGNIPPQKEFKININQSIPMDTPQNAQSGLDSTPIYAQNKRISDQGGLYPEYMDDVKVAPKKMPKKDYQRNTEPLDPSAFEDDYEETPSGKKPKRESTLSRFAKSFLLICIYVGLAVFLAFFALESASDLIGLGQKDRQIEVVIPEAAAGSISKVADILKESGVISQKITFDLYATIKKMDDKFNAGTYVLNDKWGYDQIMRKLSSKTVTQDIVTVTFYEGMSQRQIGELLEENKVCSADDFYKALENDTFDYEFIDMMPERDKLRYRKFEGYLFPDTYEFYTNMNPDEVAKKFFQNFQRKVGTDMISEIRNSDLGQLDKTIILASIIQKEASSLEEMKRVSSVFHNRLDHPDQYPNLQSDTTDDYISDSIEYFMTQKNQEMYDAYDTTKVRGLPVGPICNPGLDAITAAIHPDETEYYFFVSDNAGNYYYATTNAEHEANIQKAAAVNKQLKAEAAAKQETGE